MQGTKRVPDPDIEEQPKKVPKYAAGAGLAGPSSSGVAFPHRQGSAAFWRYDSFRSSMTELLAPLTSCCRGAACSDHATRTRARDDLLGRTR
jgi:hypothetical protein